MNKFEKSVPYEEYFNVMNLNDEQKKKRIDFAEEMEELILFLFILMSTYLENEISIIQSNIKDLVVEKYKEIVEKSIKKYTNVSKTEILKENYLVDYINDFAITIIETTEKNIDDEYYFSYDRAIFVAENEANTILNYVEFMEAILAGKKKKKWIDIRDNKERKTHREVGGEIISIERAFLVGNSLMMFPKDESMGAETKEIVNCRCTIKYF